MTVISILDRIETKGTVYVTIGDELAGKNAAEDLAISKNEWKKLTSEYTVTVGMTVNEEIYTAVTAKEQFSCSMASISPSALLAMALKPLPSVEQD